MRIGGHGSTLATHGTQKGMARWERPPLQTISAGPQSRSNALRGVPAAGLSGSSGLVNVTAIVTMAYVRWPKGFTNSCSETCVTVARSPARRRGGGTSDDRAWKPHGTAAPAGRRAARGQGGPGGGGG